MFGARRFVANLRRQHRLGPQVEPALDAELRTEILLRSARVGADSVREDFVSSLHRRLATELGDVPAPVPLGRRTVIVRLGATAAASAALGAGLDHVLTPHETPGVPEPERQLTPDDGVWTTVAQSADLPEGSALRFDVSTVIGFVSRRDNVVSAVSGICTHLGCQLDLDAPARTLNCPCHGASFAVTGAVVQHRLRVPLGPLPKIEVREVDGAIQVFAPPR
ncbi:MAG TPA: Rieske (2Fe-2S) protein [Pseudonocardiaceae bacterium]|jgi:nitrite reductase/ring-hydroxylating ferredoxin subunit|nr:Rieske (2Fe-2S) protein [Pseudonocardiaceae bacterium]